MRGRSPWSVGESESGAGSRARRRFSRRLEGLLRRGLHRHERRHFGRLERAGGHGRSRQPRAPSGDRAGALLGAGPRHVAEVAARALAQLLVGGQPHDGIFIIEARDQGRDDLRVGLAPAETDGAGSHQGLRSAASSGSVCGASPQPQQGSTVDAEQRHGERSADPHGSPSLVRRDARSSPSRSMRRAPSVRGPGGI